MVLGDGIKCRNPGMGAPSIAITAAGYCFTACNAWRVFENEAAKIYYVTNKKIEYTVELSHSTIAIVNMAFACELAFKSLLAEADRKRIHQLRDLYDKLNLKHQREIKDRAKGEVGITDDSTFLTKLDECSNNFVNWRYFYEPNKIGSQVHYHFMRAMVEEVLDMYGIDYYGG